MKVTFVIISILGEWKVNDVKPAPTGDAQEVKVKVRINHNGILLVSSAQMIEKKEALDEQNGENEPLSPTEPSPTGEAAPGQAPGDPMDTQEVSVEPLATLSVNLRTEQNIETASPCITTSTFLSTLFMCLTFC